jgi:DNA polymerase III delta subunit
MKINFNDKEFELKQSLRALIMYENVAEKEFNPKNFTDILIYLYCIVISSSKDYTMSFDSFLDYLDENPDKLNELTAWINSEFATNNIIKKN